MMLSLALALSLAADSAAFTPKQEPSRTAGSPQRLICRSRPVLGSRIATQRVCRTAEEWRVYEADLEQSRRDINDRGARGGGPNDGD